MYVDPKKLKDKDEESSQSTLTPDQLKKLYEQTANDSLRVLGTLPPSPSPEITLEEYAKTEFRPDELHHRDFLTALKYAIEGKHITKAEWNNADIYCVMENGMLCLHKNGVVHHWLISEGDTVGDDWIILFGGHNE